MRRLAIARSSSHHTGPRSTHTAAPTVGLRSQLLALLQHDRLGWSMVLVDHLELLLLVRFELLVEYGVSISLLLAQGSTKGYLLLLHPLHRL